MAVARRLAAAVATCAVLAAGCTSRLPDAHGYETWAAQNAGDMASIVASGELLAHLGGKGNLLGPYAKAATISAASDASSLESDFNNVQPPNRRSEQLRHQLDALLHRSTNALVELRIAARVGDLDALGKFEDRLTKLGDDLEQFQKAHQS